MPNIEVEIINDSRARIYNKEYKAIASEVDISIEKARQLLKERKADLVLRDKQEINIKQLEEFTNCCGVIIRAKTEVQIVGERGDMLFGRLSVSNVGGKDINIEKAMAEVFKDDIRYLWNVAYSVDRSSGKSIIFAKNSFAVGSYVNSIGDEVEKGELTLQKVAEISKENIIIRCSMESNGKHIMRYISREEAERLLLQYR